MTITGFVQWMFPFEDEDHYKQPWWDHADTMPLLSKPWIRLLRATKKDKVSFRDTVSLKWSKNLYHIRIFNFVFTLRPFFSFKTLSIFQLHTFHSFFWKLYLIHKTENILLYFLKDYRKNPYLGHRIRKVAGKTKGYKCTTFIIFYFFKYINLNLFVPQNTQQFWDWTFEFCSSSNFR